MIVEKPLKVLPPLLKFPVGPVLVRFVVPLKVVPFRKMAGLDADTFPLKMIFLFRPGVGGIPVLLDRSSRKLTRHRRKDVQIGLEHL